MRSAKILSRPRNSPRRTTLRNFQRICFHRGKGAERGKKRRERAPLSRTCDLKRANILHRDRTDASARRNSPPARRKSSSKRRSKAAALSSPSVTGTTVARRLASRSVRGAGEENAVRKRAIRAGKIDAGGKNRGKENGGVVVRARVLRRR